MEGLVITEAAKTSKGKRYKCPYCEHRDYRPNLVDHVEKEHKDMIPKDFTAARVVFNTANHKERQYCVCGCGKETAWREDLWRYDRYATKACKDKYSKQMKQNMIKTYGKEHLLDDDNMQTKMLASRSISGVYKFTSGGSMGYVGSYERKFLEFCDKVLRLTVMDLEEPGPTIYYEWQGDKHFWITDYYIPAFNLVLDIKDGGDNPNTREMEDYRGKQQEKEKAIAIQGKYNYLRLTDNNFAQLMLVMAELKLRMVTAAEEDKEYEHIIRINESNIHISTIEDYDILENCKSKDDIMKTLLECMIGIVPGGVRIPDTYVVNYMKKGAFDENIGVAVGKPNSPDFKGIIVTDTNGELELDRDMMGDRVISLYKFDGNRKEVKEPRNIVEYATGVYIEYIDELAYDNHFTKVRTYEQDCNMMMESYTALLKEQYSITTATNIMLENDDIISGIDQDGIFIKNKYTGLRSKSYGNELDIPNYVIDYIQKGEL